MRQRGRDELLRRAAAQTSSGEVNRKVIESRSVHVTAVYSVHSPFICRFS